MTTIPGAVRVLVAPNGLPCTDDPLDPGYSSALQISLRNDTGAALDLSGAHLAITFAVDPGGSGSSGALLLSPASAPGATTHPISAAVAAGTDWDVEPSPGTPGRFSAYPNGSGLLAPATTLTFLFTGIVVDLTPGATEITVDVVGIDGLTVIAAPPIAKTPASSGITQFSASPMLVLRDGSTQIQFATIGGAQAPIISWDEPSCLVVDEQGNAQLSPWTTPAASGSFTAFPDVATEFVLDMQSPGIDLGRLTVSVATPYLQLRPATIAPVEPTEFVPLSWMVLNVPDSSATLSWDEPADVHTMAGGNLTSPAVVSLIGQALVSTTTDIRFTLQTPSAGTAAVCEIFVIPVTLSALTCSPVQVDPGNAADQSVTVSWDAAHVTGFTLQTPSESVYLPPYTTSVTLNFPTAPTDFGLAACIDLPVTVTAHGYLDQSASITALPEPAVLEHFSFGDGSPYELYDGQQVHLDAGPTGVTMRWTTRNAVGFGYRLEIPTPQPVVIPSSGVFDPHQGTATLIVANPEGRYGGASFAQVTFLAIGADSGGLTLDLEIQ